MRALREEETLAWSAAHPGGVFNAVSVGYAHVCGLRRGGAVECWGEDWFGQSTAPGGRFLAVAAGVSHSCGLRPDGSVECWGEDSIDSGFFGFSEDRYEEAYSDPLGPLEDDALSKRERFGVLTLGAAALGEETLGVLVERAAGWEPPEGPYKAISASAGYTCGLRLDGEVACWGYVAGGEPRVPLMVYAEVAGERVRELHAATLAEIQRHPAEQDASPQGSQGADPSPDGTSTSEPAGGGVGTSLLGLRFELYVYDVVARHLDLVDPPAGPFVTIDAGSLQACGLRPSGEVECWGAELFVSADAPNLGRFASEALPVVVPPGAFVGDAPAAGDTGDSLLSAVAYYLSAVHGGPSPPMSGVVVVWPLFAQPSAVSESSCGGPLVVGEPLASLAAPEVRDDPVRHAAGRFVPGAVVEVGTAWLRPNSTVRLSMIGGPVPRGGEPLGDASSPVALPPAAADSQGEVSVAWTVPEAPAGRLGPMWYLLRGTGVVRLTHHSLALELEHPIIVYPDVALCAVDDEATTTAGAAVRVEVLANDIAPSGGTLDPASVSVVRAEGGEFVANADGSVTFRPEADFTGTARARYTVSDTWNINATANVTVTVKAAE
ncbi:MAG: Ig-like domain-containing protein [bacterium]|nr:Ig-like domain-containing protein [bacterium]